MASLCRVRKLRRCAGYVDGRFDSAEFVLVMS